MEDYLFQELASSYFPLIRNQIKKLHLTNEYKTYEQAGLIALWECVKNYDETKGSFSAYAYLKVRGKLIDEFRKEMRLYKQLEVQNQWEKHEESHFVPQFENELENYMILLTENQRKWVEHVIVGGMTMKAVASEEGVTLEAVKSWRKSALLKLKKELN
ncbi:MAG: sigma-70 family RNA polymerase sigma factor [Anaerobacillus sp.]